MANIRRCDPWVISRVTKPCLRYYIRDFFLFIPSAVSPRKSLRSSAPLPTLLVPIAAILMVRPLHKLWHCPAHAADRFEGAGHLKSLSIGRGLHHMTPGIHSTYDAMPNEQVACPIFLKVSTDVFWATLVLPTRANLFRKCLILLRLGNHVIAN